MKSDPLVFSWAEDAFRNETDALGRVVFWGGLAIHASHGTQGENSGTGAGAWHDVRGIRGREMMLWPDGG